MGAPWCGVSGAGAIARHRPEFSRLLCATGVRGQPRACFPPASVCYWAVSSCHPAPGLCGSPLSVCDIPSRLPACQLCGTMTHLLFQPGFPVSTLPARPKGPILQSGGHISQYVSGFSSPLIVSFASGRTPCHTPCVCGKARHTGPCAVSSPISGRDGRK